MDFEIVCTVTSGRHSYQYYVQASILQEHAHRLFCGSTKQHFEGTEDPWFQELLFLQHGKSNPVV